MKTYLLISLCVLVPLSSYADDQINGLRVAGRTATAKDLIPHRVSNENYVEKYTFVSPLRLSNSPEGSEWNGRLYFSISVSNIGPGDHNVTAKGSIHLGDQRYQWKVQRDDDEWSRDQKKLDIRVGGVQLYGSMKELHLEAKNKKGNVKISWKSIAHAWRPSKNGLTTTDKKSVEFTLLPMNEITGTFQTKNGDTISVRGIGWAEHSWSHLGPHEWSRSNIQTRIFNPDTRQAVFLRQIRSGGDYQKGQFSYALVVQGQDHIFEGYSLTQDLKAQFVDRKHDNRYTFPTEFIMKGKDIRNQSSLTAYFKTNKRDFHRNPIAKYSWVKRKVIEAVTQPMIYAYNLDYDIQVKGKSPLRFKGNNGRYEAYFYLK